MVGVFIKLCSSLNVNEEKEPFGTKPFEQISVDIVGPCKLCFNFEYIETTIDELVVIRNVSTSDVTAISVVKTIDEWTTTVVHLNQCCQMMDLVHQEYIQLYGIAKKETQMYNYTSSIMWRTNRTLSNGLRRCVNCVRGSK